MKTKTFDCVKMKWAAQEKIRAAVSGMDRKAEIEFFRAGADEFDQRMLAAREALGRRGAHDET